MVITNTRSPDGGWGWVVTGACFISHVLFVGMINTVGIYYTYLIDEFDVGLTQTTVIGGVYTGMGLAGVVFAVPLKERFGDRPLIMVGGLLMFTGYFVSYFVELFSILYITMAIIPGMGNSMSYPVLLTSVDRYFDKKKYIAMAIGISGGSVGVISLPILSEFLLSKYGFHGAILIHSALSLHIVLCGAVVFPLHDGDHKGFTGKAVYLLIGVVSPTVWKRIVFQRQKNIVPDNHKKNTRHIDMTFCRTPRYICYLFTNLLYTAGVYIPSSQLPKTAVSVGVDITDISLAVSMGGISSGCGRLCFGLLCHYFKYHIIKMWIIFLGAVGLLMSVVPVLRSTTHFLAFTIIYGLLEGGNNVGWNLSQNNLIKPHQYGRSLSIVLLVEAVGVAIGNPVTAYFKESLNSPGLPYYIGTSILVLSAVILCPFSRTKMEHITEVSNTIKVPRSQSTNNEISSKIVSRNTV